MAAKPSLKPGPKRILFIPDQMSQCAWYRCSVPGSEMAKMGHEVGLTLTPSESDVGGADVVVFLRHFSTEALNVMRAAKSAGKLVVYDIDDALWDLDPTNPAFPFYSQPEIKRGIKACIREAHLVTTTTEALAKQLKGLNSRVTILPNMLPAEAWPFKGAKPQSDEHVIVGWAGGPSHYADLDVIRDVGTGILESFPNVWLVCAGIDSTPFPSHPRFRLLPWGPIEEYSSLLSTFDIGVAPLVDSKFNRSKSDLKALEYSMVGIPVVASHVESYRSFVKNGETGFLAKDAGQWRDALGRLIESRELREKMGGAGNELARARLIDRTVGMWVDAYGLPSDPDLPSTQPSDVAGASPWRVREAGFVGEVKGRHKGETCYIVGKGPSLAGVTDKTFGPGPIICLNQAVRHVQGLGLSNAIYSMQKDGCGPYHQRDVGCTDCAGERPPMAYPDESITLLLHEHESRNCLPRHPKRLVFDAVDELGFGWWSTSAPCAIRIAKVFGCDRVVLIAHDSLFGEYGTVEIEDGFIELAEGGPGERNYKPIAELVMRELCGIDYEIVPPTSGDAR